MCRKIGKFHWEERAVAFHDHPGIHGWSDETYDKHYRRVYESESMRKDRSLLYKRAKEFGFKVTFGCGGLGEYPNVPEVIDLRKRILPKGMTVLNVGVGPGDSWIASQLPHLEFKLLDNIDIHKPYIDKARELPWAAEEVRFKVADVTKMNGELAGYDTVFMFDVIEHLPKEDGIKILNESFNKLLFVPLEDTPRENPTEVPSQDHVSQWTEKEFRDLGYKTELIKGFMHRTDGTVSDALWAWS
jgi:hypothetical protein